MPRPFPLLRLSLGFLIAALAAELADELVDGATGSAWPLVRSDLHLSYAQIGLLLGLPALFANVIEPLFGLMADRGYRQPLILGGGVVFALSLGLFAVSGSFWVLLVSLLLFYPASGAFVSLTQAALMDAEPGRREQNMARWTLVGSVGNVIGPLLVGLSVTLGLGWRAVFGLLAVLTAGALTLMWRSRSSLMGGLDAGEGLNFREAWRDIRGALARADVRRWLLLLEAGNLTADVFRGLVALYFVDAVGASPAVAGLAVTVFTGVGLLGDVLVVPLLERVPGVAYLRVSSLLTALLFPAFLLVPQPTLKLVLLGLLGLLNAGWYAVLQARLYATLPGRSGTVMALGSVSGMIGGLVPLALGAVAQRFGLEAALWCLLAGPLALLLGLPRERQR